MARARRSARNRLPISSPGADVTDWSWRSAARRDHKQTIVSADERKLLAVRRPRRSTAASQPPQPAATGPDQLNPTMLHHRQATAIRRPARRTSAIARQPPSRTRAGIDHEHLRPAPDRPDGGQSPRRRRRQLPPEARDLEQVQTDAVCLYGSNPGAPDRRHEPSVGQKSEASARIPIVRTRPDGLQPRWRNRARQAAAIGVDHTRLRAPHVAIAGLGRGKRNLGSVGRPHRIPRPTTSRPSRANPLRVRTICPNQDQTGPTGRHRRPTDRYAPGTQHAPAPLSQTTQATRLPRPTPSELDDHPGRSTTPPSRMRRTHIFGYAR